MGTRIVSGSGVSRPPAERAKKESRFSGIHIVAGVLGLLVMILVIALAAVLMRGPSTPAQKDNWTAQQWRDARSQEVVKEVAKGLGQSSSTVSKAAGMYRGWPTGWDHSLDGAVAQSGVIAQFLGNAQVADYDSRDIYTKLTGRVIDSEDTYEAFNAHLGVDKDGYLVDRQGQRIDDRKLVAAVYPRYGAYKIVDVTFFEDHSVEDVAVLWWLPSVKGYKSASTGQTDFKITWQTRLIYLTWNSEKSMFELAFETVGKNLPDVEENKTNLSFDQRAEYLGSGWMVPADATEERLPDVLGAKS